MKYHSKSNQETIKIGEKITPQLKGGDIVLLEGDLGAGKTTLVKGIAKEFGIKETIVSPTFTLMQVYKVRSSSPIRSGIGVRSLVHIDTYRLKDEEQLKEIGVEDYLGDPETVCLIEWPEKIKTLLKNKKTIGITIGSIDEKQRKIIITKN